MPELLYENPLASASDVRDFRMEGDGAISFPRGRLRLEGLRDPGEGQRANIVFWCPEDFGPGIEVSWDFTPLHERGLCILFFAARGRSGEDLFDPALAPRDGPYEQYHSSDINAYHLSYFRRMWGEERAFHTTNLRKSKGFHLVAQGPDPLPGLLDARGPYRMCLWHDGDAISFGINDLPCLFWRDDGSTGGAALGQGKIGFRQMAPMIAEYSNLRVVKVTESTRRG